MEVFDFCLRSLFTNKSNPLNKVIKYVCPTNSRVFFVVTRSTKLKLFYNDMNRQLTTTTTTTTAMMHLFHSLDYWDQEPRFC
jgi:hypothetical protein